LSRNVERVAPITKVDGKATKGAQRHWQNQATPGHELSSGRVDGIRGDPMSRLSVGRLVADAGDPRAGNVLPGIVEERLKRTLIAPIAGPEIAPKPNSSLGGP